MGKNSRKKQKQRNAKRDAPPCQVVSGPEFSNVCGKPIQYRLIANTVIFDVADGTDTVEPSEVAVCNQHWKESIERTYFSNPSGFRLEVLWGKKPTPPPPPEPEPSCVLYGVIPRDSWPPFYRTALTNGVSEGSILLFGQESEESDPLFYFYLLLEEPVTQDFATAIGQRLADAASVRLFGGGLEALSKQMRVLHYFARLESFDQSSPQYNEIKAHLSRIFKLDEGEAGA